MTAKLTKLEQYQFSLCRSAAKTVTAQRSAIKREGLENATPATVRAARWENFKQWKAKQKDLDGLPGWLAAARYEKSGESWVWTYPAGRVGEVRHVSTLAALAHDAVDWGRL